ncbi:MAG: efflux RND transporter periplasmic adaptor subunit [Paracoccaceae bacterium]|nr:efflux RND transporter periplasmic adaptor subunit [Paracoccaceae bacterium]
MIRRFIGPCMLAILVAQGGWLAGARPAQAQSLQPLTCLLVPARTSDIGSDRVGIVRAVDVRRADFVEQDAPLVRIDAEIAEADLRVARISIAALEERLGRSEGLLSRNLISRDEIGALRTDLQLALANEARAQMELSRATIRAPFAGYVSNIGVSVGELIGPDPLLQLIEVSTLRAELVYLAGAFGLISVGDALMVHVEMADAEVEAVVTAIDPFIDATSNSFTVLAEIENTDLSLPAGTSCAVLN